MNNTQFIALLFLVFSIGSLGTWMLLEHSYRNKKYELTLTLGEAIYAYYKILLDLRSTLDSGSIEKTTKAFDQVINELNLTILEAYDED